MGKITLKTLSFELGYFMIEILLDFITKRKMTKIDFKRFEKYGQNMGPVKQVYYHVRERTSQEKHRASWCGHKARSYHTCQRNPVALRLSWPRCPFKHGV